MSIRTVPSERSPGAEAKKAPDHRWWVLSVVGLAQLMVVLDATVVNIALPHAQAALHFSIADRQWVITGYSLAFGSLLLLGGRLSDLFGRRRTLMTGLAGFALVSALGGASVNFPMLVAARTVQGAFGALLAPAALAILTTTFVDSADRNKAFAIYGSIAAGGSAIGLLLGGALTSYASWRWTLYINIVFAAIALFGARTFIPHRPDRSRAQLDIPGTLLVSAGLFGLVYGFSHAETTSWHNPFTIASLTIGTFLVSIFFVFESRTPHPLMPIRVIADRSRGGSFLSFLVGGAGMFGVFLFLTYYMQETRGYSAVETGLAFLPIVVAVTTVAAVANIVLLPRLGPRLLIPGGLLVSTGGMVALTRLGLHSSYAGVILPSLLIVGAGLGLTFAPATNTATARIRSGDAGVASATVNTTQQIGGSMGTALLNTIAADAAQHYLLTHSNGRQPSTLLAAQAAMHSYTTAFWWSAAIFAAGAIICLFLIGGLRPSPAQVDGISEERTGFPLFG